MRATANRHLQRYQEALQDAAYILKTQKNNTNAWYNLGLIYFSVEDYDEARQAFERGAALGDAKCSQALNDLACVLFISCMYNYQINNGNCQLVAISLPKIFASVSQRHGH